MPEADANAVAAPAAEDFQPTIFDCLEVDATAEEDGRWFKEFLGPGIDGDIKLRALTSRPVVEAKRRLDLRYSKLLVDGRLPDELEAAYIAELYAEAVVLDWRGRAFRDKTGEPIAYDKAAAKALLAAMRHFRNRVTRLADNMDGFRPAADSAAAKN